MKIKIFLGVILITLFIYLSGVFITFDFNYISILSPFDRFWILYFWLVLIFGFISIIDIHYRKL